MTADTVGGVWTYALDLARALAPHRVSVALATMGRLPTPAQRAEADAVPGLTLHSSEFALEWMGNPWDDVARAGDWLLGLEADWQPDVIHLNGYAHGSLPWHAPVLMVGHSCVLSWWRTVNGTDAPPDWDRYRAEVSGGLKAAKRVIAPTQAMLDALQTFYGPLPATGVIPNGRNPVAFAPGKKEPFVFSAGRLWDEAKNIAALAAIAPRLPWPVLVAGDTWHPSGRSAAAENVCLVGNLSGEEIARRLAHAAVYALPARYEPFGLSALEAGLSGCALVLGDIPSLREVWGDAALFVPPDDPDALHAALNRLIGDVGLREGMAARARLRAQGYTPERMAQSYRKAYGALLQENAGCA